jgi:hypothetical protein
MNGIENIGENKMLLKKIFYGYTRVTGVSVEVIRDVRETHPLHGEISITFHRFRPLGPDKKGRKWVYHSYVPKNPGKFMDRIKRILGAGYFFCYRPESWLLQYHTPEIKEICWKFFLDNFLYLWLMYIIIRYYFYGK